MPANEPPEGSAHIVKIVIDLYRTQHGTIHYVQNSEVRGDDPKAEDANIHKALLAVAHKDFPHYTD